MTQSALDLTLPCFEHPRAVDWRPGDAVLLATKVGDAESALDELVRTAGAGVPVICATNGIQTETWAAQRFETVISMLVWLPSTHLVPGEVRLHTAGSLGVLDSGPARGDADLCTCERVSGVLRSAGFDAVTRPDIARWKAAKLLTNVGNTAQALVDGDWRRVAHAAREEAQAVFAAAGVDHVALDELGARVARVEEGSVDGAMRGGGSTWQSHQRGRALETPWLEGAIAEMAKRFGIEAPINTGLAAAGAARTSVSAEELCPSSGSGAP